AAPRRRRLPPALHGSLRTLIIGAGALGGLIGARLAATGAQVSFAVRDRASAERLRQAGFRVSGVGGPVIVPASEVTALDEVQAAPELDLVVLATQAPDAMETPPPPAPP